MAVLYHCIIKVMIIQKKLCKKLQLKINKKKNGTVLNDVLKTENIYEKY